MKKHSLFVFHTESIFPRGGEKYLFEILKRLSAHYAITVFFQDVSKEWARSYKNTGIHVESLWKPKRFYWLLVPLTTMVNFFRLKHRVGASDVIFATNFPVNLLAILLSKKTIIHCWEPLPIFYDKTYIASLRPISRFAVSVAKLLYAHIDKLVINKCSLLTTLNRDVERFIIPVYGRKADIFLPNGVDTHFFTPKSSPLFKKPTDTFIIGHSTDYTVFKGTENLLKAFSLLPRATPKIQLLISESITNEQAKQKYLSFIREHKLTNMIRFVGKIPESSMPNYYTSLDVFCFAGSTTCPTSITASLSVLEAQSCGTPVLRSNGNNEEVIDQKTGVLFDPNDHPKTARAILTFIKLGLLQQKTMKILAREHAVKNFSWKKPSDVLTKGLTQLYNKTP